MLVFLFWITTGAHNNEEIPKKTLGYIPFILGRVGLKRRINFCYIVGAR